MTTEVEAENRGPIAGELRVLAMSVDAAATKLLRARDCVGESGRAVAVADVIEETKDVARPLQEVSMRRITASSVSSHASARARTHSDSSNPSNSARYAAAAARNGGTHIEAVTVTSLVCGSLEDSSHAGTAPDGVHGSCKIKATKNVAKTLGVPMERTKFNKMAAELLVTSVRATSGLRSLCEVASREDKVL